MELIIRIQFHIQLPEKVNLRVGYIPPGEGNLFICGPDGRSLRGYEGREYNRFYPVILLLEAYTRINEWQFKQDNYAPLFQSGVVYREEPPGCEDWPDIPTLYKQGWGDCEDLACTRTAELRLLGIPAVPCIRYKDFYHTDGAKVTLVHVLVLWPDGTIEDPSRILGMKGSFDNTR